MSNLRESSPARTLSVRLPASLYDEMRKVATRKNLSLNALIGQGIVKLIDEAHDQEMEDAATLLSQDPEMMDVEFAFAAQAEVVLAGENPE